MCQLPAVAPCLTKISSNIFVEVAGEEKAKKSADVKSEAPKEAKETKSAKRRGKEVMGQKVNPVLSSPDQQRTGRPSGLPAKATSRAGW